MEELPEAEQGAGFSGFRVSAFRLARDAQEAALHEGRHTLHPRQSGSQQNRRRLSL